MNEEEFKRKRGVVKLTIICRLEDVLRRRNEGYCTTFVEELIS